MLNDPKKDLKSLIKETPGNLCTYTKYKPDNPELLENELVTFNFIKSLGMNTPDIVYSTKDCITTQFLPGLSVYRILEILWKNNRENEIFDILDLLCRDLTKIHNNINQLSFEGASPYDVTKKMQDVVQMLKVEDGSLASALNSKLPSIISLYKRADVPFLDRTPKNYIIRNSKETEITSGAKVETDMLYYFDFSSARDLTFQADDYVSIYFHYFVSDDMRSELINTHNLSLTDESNLVSTFVRLSRFWVRRKYYQLFQPEEFKKRYERENILFYERVFKDYLNKTLDIL